MLPGRVRVGFEGEHALPNDPARQSLVGCRFSTRRCTDITPTDLPLCGKEDLAEARDYLELETKAAGWLGRTVSIFGTLRPGLLKEGSCRPHGPCCRDNQLVVLGVGSDNLFDPAPRIHLNASLFLCTGDASMLCCRTTALGSTVVARGRLELINGLLAIQQPKVCVVPPR